MYKTAEKQRIQTGTKAAPAQRATNAPTTAIPNSAMASMAGSGGSGYATPNLDQMMQARMGGLHEDMAAEKEAVDVGRQFMDSTDVVGDMSRAYGQDLSGVRLHTDPGAAAKAEERGVDAFSTGRDIYFAQGAYDRSDPASRGLLAHELSHSLQQGVGGDASVMTQSAPVGAEQGGWRDWFRKKPKQSEPEPEPELEISEPQKWVKRSWEQGLISDAISQRDNALETAKTKKEKAAAQAKFMEQMGEYSKIESGGKINLANGATNYSNLSHAALHQIVKNMSSEDMRKDTALQNRIIGNFNTRVGAEFEACHGRTEGLGGANGVMGELVRGNGVGEALTYNDMLIKLVPPGMVKTLCNTMYSNEDARTGAMNALDFSVEKMQEDPIFMNALEGVRSGYERAEFLNTDEEVDQAIMINSALRSFMPTLTVMEKAEKGKSTRAPLMQKEMNTGESEHGVSFRNMLANRRRKQR